MEWTTSLEEFKKYLTDPDYGKSIFPKSILADGRIMVETYKETQFIFRNDSLFEIEDTVSRPKEYFDLIVNHASGFIDDKVFNAKKDSIDLIYNGKHAYIPKLIFTRDMFKSGRKKVKLPRKVNYLRDEIQLDQQWIEDGKKCYLIRINNVEDGDETTYAYAINEDIKFVWWQGCRKQQASTGR